MEMKEREISLLDLFAEILLHWRGILMAMLLGGILLGGVNAIRRSQEEVVLPPWEAVDEVQQTKVHVAAMLKDQYEAALDYWQKSALRRLAPQHAQQAELTFAVRAESYQRAYAIADIYAGLLEDAALYGYVEGKCGTDGSVKELVSLKGMSGSGQYALGSKDVIIAMQNMRIMGNGEGTGDGEAVAAAGRVQILYDDAEICSAMADAVVEFLRQRSGELEKEIGSHELVVLGRSQGEAVGGDIAFRISQNMDTLARLESQAASRLAAFTEEEKAYYEYLLAGGPQGGDAGEHEAQPDSTGGQGTAAKQDAMVAPAASASWLSRLSVKYVFLGAVLAAFLYAFAVFLKYIMDGKLRGTDSFLELYGVPHLGTVPAAAEEKRFLGVIDKWIRRLQRRSQRVFTREEAAGLAAAAVKMAALKKGAGRVCCMGCGLKGDAREVCGQIQKQLEAAGVRAEVLDNVLYDAEEMSRLEGAGSVVLVETAGATLYGEICRELELLQRQEIPVLGGIVVE